MLDASQDIALKKTKPHLWEPDSIGLKQVYNQILHRVVFQLIGGKSMQYAA